MAQILEILEILEHSRSRTMKIYLVKERVRPERLIPTKAIPKRNKTPRDALTGSLSSVGVDVIHVDLACTKRSRISRHFFCHTTPLPKFENFMTIHDYCFDDHHDMNDRNSN